MALLNREQILARLEKGEIFRPGSWRTGQVRPAGYDLRIDSEVRAFNDTIYEEGQYSGESLDLKPGDTAFVLSFERFCMPWNLAANLGPRFRFARRGLSVLTGVLVDPGYGMRKKDDEWVHHGEPLHFFLTNTGAAPISIALGEEGDAVLSVQFLETAELLEKRETLPPGNVKPSKALWAVHGQHVLQEQVGAQNAMMKERLGEMDARIDSLDRDVTNTRSATENIVVFGVFLVAVTLLGVSTTILIQALASGDATRVVDTFNRVDPQGFAATAVALAAVAVIGASVMFGALAVTRGFAWAFASRREQPGSPPGASSSKQT